MTATTVTGHALGERVTSWSALRVWIALVAVAYVVFVLGGVTTSSVGVPRLSESAPGFATDVLAGTPRRIRSDEYLRSTPWVLGLMARGSDAFASPLAYPDVALVAPTARDLPSALMHWEAVAFTAGTALPDEMLFAAVWWFPVALVAILFPLWLVRLGAVPGIAVFATALLLLAPANHWWSWGPMGVLAPVLLAAVLAITGLDRWCRHGLNAPSMALFAMATLSVAKAAVGYAPWTIPLATAIFVPTLVGVPGPRTRRLGLVCLGAVILGGVVLAVALVAPSGAVDVIAGTVYPGERRSIGEFVGWGLLFGAPHLWILQAAPEILPTTNESELAGGYLFLALPGAVLAFGIDWACAGRLGAAAAASGAVTVLLALWVTFDWPHAIGSLAFPLTLVPPERMAQVLGLVATIAFAFVLSAWSRSQRVDRRRMALLSAVLVGVFTALGGRTLKAQALPTLPVAAIVLTAILVALAVAFLVWRPDSGFALAALPVLVVLVVGANPLQRGFGDLRSSSAASAVRTMGAALGDDRYWGSDDPAVDALLMSNGEQSLSGQQWVGPRETAWRTLDPSGEQRQAWNRGASFVVFRWAPGATTRISARKKDLIEVRVDPCAPALRRLGLGLVVSRRQLSGGCLVERARMPWGGTDRWVYSIQSPLP